MKVNPESVARSSSRHPLVTIGVWIVVLVVAGYLSSTLLADVLTTDFDFTDTPESKQALELVEERLRPETFLEFIVVTSDSATAQDPVYMEFVEDLRAEVLALGSDVIRPEGVVSYMENPFFVSADGRSTLLAVPMEADSLGDASEHAEVLGAKVHELSEPSGFEVLVAGQGTVNNDFNHLAEETLRRGESFGISIALGVLLVVIGAVVAALLPLILAIAAIFAAFGVTALVGQLFELSFFVTNMITMIGLAVGIDYSLFIVARYREERIRGFERLEAIGRSGATAGRAVFFSGMTVVLALVGMLFVPNTIFRSLGIGAIIVVLLAVAASMTLLPAVFRLLGDKVNALPVRRRRSLDNVDKIGGMWDRITKTVMARPIVWMLTGLVFMVTLSLAFFSMETGFAGVSTLPEDTESHQAFAVLERDFSGGLAEPVEVVIDGAVTPEVEAAVADLQARMAATGDFGPPTVDIAPSGDLVVVSAPLVYGDSTSTASTAAVESLRTEIVPEAFAGVAARPLVGGFTAFTLDFFEDVDVFTPIVFFFVLGLSFVLLTIVFRSLVVPIKAIILNLLSVGAAYGMIVLFFQRDVGPEWIKDISSAFGFLQVDTIEAWLPLMLFSVLFGLSMDYHVFLLTRIREHYDRTGSNSEAVAHGLRTTGAIITGAALIMVAVFGGFAAGDLVPFQQMGFGLAVAVFLDATIIRSVMVPATMRLLGNVNWYLPKWLQWLPELDIEGHEAAAAAHGRPQVGVAGD